MLHVRIVSPASLTERVVEVITQVPLTINLVVVPGAARHPPGDLVECDIARESANTVLTELNELGIADSGSVTMETLDISVSKAAEEAEDAGPVEASDTVIWAELSQRATEDVRITWAFLMFLVLATQISAIGSLLDQPILIVGGMVLGPEFGPIAAICLGLIQREPVRIGKAAATLTVGFAVAFLVTLVCAVVSRWWGWIEPSMLLNRPLTQFIVSPDKWSFIIAVLAGVAGILSLTSGKSAALVGVFISVTTVPAVGNMAIAAALSSWPEVGSSAIQLGINLLGVILAGTATLGAQKLWLGWQEHRVARRNRR